MLKLKNTVGGVAMPPTKRLKIGSTIWIDIIHANPANQLFRARMAEYKGVSSIDEVLGDRSKDRDDRDKIRSDLAELIFNCCIQDWGGWDKDGKACALFDDNGDPVECTQENFVEIVRDVEGGEQVFYEVHRVFKNQAWFKVKQSDQEKNFLSPSRQQSTKEAVQRTRKGRKRAAA